MDIICFSHLRWDFVWQRPQHLMRRFARQQRVYFIEEAVFDAESCMLEVRQVENNLYVVVPRFHEGLTEQESLQALQLLLNEWLLLQEVEEYIAWYYTPMALPVGLALPAPVLIVYDCMDELSAFKHAAASIKEKEEELLTKADLVFTGGFSLYEAKRKKHNNIHLFPSSIDKDHFAKARQLQAEPADQFIIPRPHIGFFGVIDERMNLALLEELASLKPEWHFIFIGPVVKIDAASLPVRENIHYLGSRAYEELPAYLGGWDTALIPFALNEATAFISPTKTPEYLAGGVPVVSTSIKDVVHPYADQEFVFIADTADEFVMGIECSFNLKHDAQWLTEIDEFLAGTSWDKTWHEMVMLIQKELDLFSIEKQIRKNGHYV